ncbi:hypothetical protein F4818DRAFT_441071 [Hypoxylon cercidicola]|nr:hypothetical protein F4818DRAFT_441071 [Hypoxylon cercidicola]
MLSLIDRLGKLKDKFFPTPDFDPEGLSHGDDGLTDEDEWAASGAEKPYEPTMLWHDNISLDNILVDEDGVLRGVIDWQCISSLPLYEACQFPAFLQQARDRLTEPRTPYRVNRAQLDISQDLREYDMDLRQHQISMLRQLFLAEMADRCPDWVRVFQSQGDLRDYEAAVQNCDNEFAYEMVERWVTSVEEGGVGTKFSSEIISEKEIMQHGLHSKL